MSVLFFLGDGLLARLIVFKLEHCVDFRVVHDMLFIIARTLPCSCTQAEWSYVWLTPVVLLCFLECIIR